MLRTKKGYAAMAIAAAICIGAIANAAHLLPFDGPQPSSTGATTSGNLQEADLQSAPSEERHFLPSDYSGTLLEDELGHLEGTIELSCLDSDDDELPQYSGSLYAEVNSNVPELDELAKAIPKGTELYGPLDELGRCTYAIACLGPENEPTKSRESISEIRPSGWVQNMNLGEAGLDHLYERSHLIAHRLSSENANARNLVTGTAQMNQEAMAIFEQEVDDYIDGTGNHVLLCVTPIFIGDELVARGVQMQASSIEDGGKGVSFNVYCFNVQPGVQIDYLTGRSQLEQR